MPEPKRQPMSWDDYLAWEATQPVKHELVGGEVRAMTGGTTQHDIICNNLRGQMWSQLRGHLCRVQGPDLKVRTGTGNARYPDALIDCGKQEIGAIQAGKPVAVFEVLSRSTLWIDLNDKFDDYDATPTIRHYVLIFQDQVRVIVYGRNNGGDFDRKRAPVLRSLGDTLSLPDPAIALPLQVLYEGVELDA